MYVDFSAIYHCTPDEHRRDECVRWFLYARASQSMSFKMEKREEMRKKEWRGRKKEHTIPYNLLIAQDSSLVEVQVCFLRFRTEV